jgi:hypothetical protein
MTAIVSNPPRTHDRTEAHCMYENLSVIPVSARVKKLRSMKRCIVR